MNARLGFAVAAHLDPDVLLIDEVLSVGDLAFQEKCYERMRRFVRSGIAVVFVSHNLSAISSLCDRVLVLRRGGVDAGSDPRGHHHLRPDGPGRRGDLGTGPEIVLELLDDTGRPVAEADAGARLIARSRSSALVRRVRLYSELQVRHLETGNVVYRCQSRFAGVESVGCGRGRAARDRLDRPGQLWSRPLRGHDGTAQRGALLGGPVRPVLLTVTERQSEQAVVYLAARCEARSAPVAVAGAGMSRTPSRPAC